MTRTTSRLVVSGVLRTTTALRVGAARSTGDIDLPLLRDGLGRAFVPGASLAGALRHWAVDNGVPNDTVDLVFGGHIGASGASRLSVADMVIADKSGVSQRTGVGIDRATGAAAPGVLFAIEVVPAGVELALEAELDVPTGGDDASAAMALVGSLLGALERGEIQLGAMSSRGLGGVVLDPAGTSVRLCDFTSRESTLAALTGGTVVDRASLGDKPPRGNVVTLEVRWRPSGTVMSKGAVDGLAVDSLPLVEVGADGTLLPVLPGSSLKGVFRSFVERMWRTATGQVAAPSLRASDVLDQIVVGDFIDSLFGAVADDEAGTGRRSRRGALRVEDCRARVGMPPELWRSVLTEHEQSGLIDTLDSASLSRSFTPAMHVGIDRWTGGAAEHLLYSVLEVREVDWEPLRIRLDLAQVARGLEPDAADRRQRAALGVLLVLARSMSEGLIRFGFAAYRGAGGVIVDSITLSAVSSDPVVRAVIGDYTDLPAQLPPSSAAPLMAALADERDLMATAGKHS